MFNMKLYKTILLILLIPICCFAKQKIRVHHPGVKIPYEPWFTGMLISPIPINMQPGHPAIEPALLFFSIYGDYDDDWKLKREKTIWAISPVLDVEFGITDRIGVEIFASYIINYQDGKKFDHFQDTLVNLGFQLADDIKDSWVPDFRLLLLALFPSGKFHRFDPDLFGLDQTGQGAIQLGFQFAFQKLFYLPKNFFLLNGGFGYLYPFDANVKGFNAFGGGFETKGKIRPGETLVAYLGGEYSLNQRWVISLDSEFFYQTETSSFRGKLGTTRLGEIAEIGLPPKTQISLNPFVEYNFNAHSGLLMGTWFTIAGRNTPAFAAILLAYLYIF